MAPITIQLGSMESSVYETRKSVKEYLQTQNVAINEVPNHIELSVEMLNDFENLCYLYDTNPQVFEYSYTTLCTVRAFLAQNEIPIAFFNEKEYIVIKLIKRICHMNESDCYKHHSLVTGS